MKSEAHLVARPVFNAIGLCAGVGMLDEGARTAFEHLGFELRTVAYGEWEAAAASQLVALMEAGALDAAPVWCGDFRRLDAGRFRGLVDFIIAGFPCQDISLAGRRAGLDGKRSGLFFDIVDFADACGASGLILEADPRWANIIERWPFLAPATESGLRVLADESSLVVDESRNHQLRQVGNGCVPLQAALAIVVLARRAGVLT